MHNRKRSWEVVRTPCFQVRALPLEPTFEHEFVKGPLPLTPPAPLDLAGVESAARALVEALAALRAPAGAPPGTAPAGLAIVDLCNEFLLAKARAGRSDKYLRVSLAPLKAFCALGQ